MQRGIVIGARITLNDAGQFKGLTGSVNNDDLVRWLLYWDQVTYAGLGRGGASLTGNHTNDVNFLESAGVFRTKVVDVGTLDFRSFPAAQEGGMSIFGLAENQSLVAFAAARFKLAEDLSRESGEIWTVGQAGGEQLILPGIGSRRELIDVQLVNCLPVPAGETPFAEILEFKAKHRAELERLRIALDALRERILMSADERRAIHAVISELSSSLTDIHKALRGSGIRTLVESVGLYTNNPSLSFWTALGGVAASNHGLPVEFGAAVGLALPTAFRFLSRAVDGPRQLPTMNADFAYAIEAVRQLK